MEVREDGILLTSVMKIYMTDMKPYIKESWEANCNTCSRDAHSRSRLQSNETANATRLGMSSLLLCTSRLNLMSKVVDQFGPNVVEFNNIHRTTYMYI